MYDHWRVCQWDIVVSGNAVIDAANGQTPPAGVTLTFINWNMTAPFSTAPSIT
jgi:hypothetical protein